MFLIVIAFRCAILQVLRSTFPRIDLTITFSRTHSTAVFCLCALKKRNMQGIVASTCLNYWITFTWSISCVGATSENIIHRGVASDDAGAIWISGDFYIRENSKTRRRPVSRSKDHSRFSASLLPTLVLQSARLGRTNVGAPARHVCKGGFLFAWCKPPSLVPLLLSAREIRYEGYLCIFENLPWMQPAKVSWAFLTLSRTPPPFVRHFSDELSPQLWLFEIYV